MQISTVQAQDVTVVAPSGRLDMASAPSLRSEFQQLVESGVTRIVVDLGEVPFMDSTGVGTIIGGLKLARAAGGNLRIARPQGAIQLVLSLSNLEKVLHPYPTIEAAQADL